MYYDRAFVTRGLDDYAHQPAGEAAALPLVGDDDREFAGFAVRVDREAGDAELDFAVPSLSDLATKAISRS